MRGTSNVRKSGWLCYFSWLFSFSLIGVILILTKPGFMLTGSWASAQRLCELEALDAVTALSLFSGHIQHRVAQLGPFGVVTLGPVVARAGLSKDEVIWPEDLQSKKIQTLTKQSDNYKLKMLQTKAHVIMDLLPSATLSANQSLSWHSFDISALTVLCN